MYRVYEFRGDENDVYNPCYLILDEKCLLEIFADMDMNFEYGHSEEALRSILHDIHVLVNCFDGIERAIEFCRTELEGVV